MKTILCLGMAGFFLLAPAGLVFSKVSKTSQESWSALADYHQLRGKAPKPVPADKKPNTKKNKSR